MNYIKLIYSGCLYSSVFKGKKKLVWENMLRNSGYEDIKIAKQKGRPKQSNKAAATKAEPNGTSILIETAKADIEFSEQTWKCPQETIDRRSVMAAYNMFLCFHGYIILLGFILSGLSKDLYYSLHLTTDHDKRSVDFKSASVRGEKKKH